MFRKIFLGCLAFLLLYDGANVAAAAEDSDMAFCLSRRGADSSGRRVDFCRHYAKDSKILFDDNSGAKPDLVYGPTYDNLNNDIDKHLNFLRLCSNKQSKVNFLTVILSATGKNEEGEISRVYNPLYVYQKGSNITFRLYNNKSKTRKISVFTSDDYNSYKKSLWSGAPAEKIDFSLQSFNEETKEIQEQHGFSLWNLNTLQNKEINGSEGKLPKESHTEPLCLAILKTLSNQTFQTLLMEEYKLMYGEIHFMSTFDACSNCAKMLQEEIDELTKYFQCGNLFVFFHSNHMYASGENYYTIKYAEKCKRRKEYEAGKLKCMEGFICGIKTEYFRIREGKPVPGLKGQRLQWRKKDTFLSSPSYLIGIIRSIDKEEYGISHDGYDFSE